MNKYFCFAFLFLTPSFLFGQLTDEYTFWIATESRQLKDEGIYPMDGSIMRFLEDSLYMHHIFHDSIMAFDAKVTPKKIRLDGKKWGRINSWDDDSLVLDFDNWMQVKFIPVSNGDCERSELAFWDYGDYVGKDSMWDFSLKLLDVPWVLYPNDIARECIVQVGGRRHKYSELEKWSVVELDDNHIFSKTVGQFEPQIFRVLEYRNDTAFFELLGKENYKGLFLAKKPKVPDEEYRTIVEKLTAGRWRTKEVLDFAHSFDNDPIFDEIEPVRTLRIDSILFTKSSLLEGQLSFEFSGDGECMIYQSEVPVYSGKWKLLPSGNEIVLDDYNYIDIISSEDNALVIGKFDKFDVSAEEGKEERD